ncbi:MAG: hypothetical protein EGR46_11400 [Ruminococcus sp.]|uniref:hypothetical protein n=1 Tax=Ruminococcus sp. TaxID=41978 RepID=UPI0025E41F8C|nr:hypothetical protein [Ruminococcus sp.]MBD9049523.1 hypothetical protein [Ruminococcus sp.]
MIDDDEIIVDEELAEYFEKGDFSDLTFRTIYEKYSTWRIKEVFREAGYELKPVYLGYKALRYRPCQRYWIIDMSNGQKMGTSYNGYSFEDLRYFLGKLGIPLHGDNYRSKRPSKDENGRRYACEEFLKLAESLPDEKEKTKDNY